MPSGTPPKGQGTGDKGASPGDYAVGSPQSRAAARALVERRFAARKRLEIVCSIPRPGAVGEIRIGEWIEGADGTIFRTSNIPAGMTLQEAERIVAERGKAIRDRRAGLVGVREAAENLGTLRGLSGD